jgi:translation initiation factor IF-2
MQGRQNFTQGESRSGERVRLYEVAKEVGLPNRELVAKVRSLGIDVKNHMSSMDVEDVARVKRALEKERIESREVKRISATVMRRRSRSAPPRKADAPKQTTIAPAAPSIPSTPRIATPTPAPTLAPTPAQEKVETRPAEADDASERVGAIESDVAASFRESAAVADARGVEEEPVAESVGASARQEPSEAPGATSSESQEAASADVEQAELTQSSDTTKRAELSADSGAKESAEVVSADAQGTETPAKQAEQKEESTQDGRADKATTDSDSGASKEESAKKAGTDAGISASAPSARDASEKGMQTVQRDRPSTSEASPAVNAEKDEKKKEEIDISKLPINSPLRRKAQPKREIRFAPGFKPPGQRPQPRPPQPRASEAQPLSAADALKMMAPAAPRRHPQQVVITNLDSRQRPGSTPTDRRFKGGRRKKKQATGKKGQRTQITTPAEHKRVIRVEGAIAVSDMARQMGVKSNQVLAKLWGLGMTNIMINEAIDADTASLLANEFGYEIENVEFKEADVLAEVVDQPEDLYDRAPVVTVMGHVDHGKTSLLDAIRGSDVVSGEAGGITQHMAAYRVNTSGGEVVFLDTPGHAAFTQMRARGAQCTDIVVLVVAADDGVMPQTIEAIDHSRDAGVPIVVALNKIDKPDANRDRVLGELAERDLVPEDWGGQTIVVPVSAITKEGISDLLESLVLQAELLELKANPQKFAKGSVVEARMDRARGAMCTVLVQEGTLRVGDTIVCGEHMGKVRALLDDRGEPVDEAGPSTPVELLGLGGVPQAGDVLNAVADDKVARQLAEHRHNSTRQRDLASSGVKSVEQILDALRSGDARELKLLIKADVQGSSEAIRESVSKLSTEKVQVNVISAGVGGIHETDVNLAKAAGALVVGFNIRTAGKASQLAEREGVRIETYDVIYELLDDVKDLMRGLLPKERSERLIGRAEVRQTFSIPKIGMIAGCAVIDGKITRNSQLRLIRDNVKIYDGRVSSLKRFKDDVREVVQGYECGIGIEGYNSIQESDVIEAYEVDEVTPEL